jgi:hypothetical protein
MNRDRDHQTFYLFHDFCSYSTTPFPSLPLPESAQDMCPSTSTTSMTSLLAALHAFVQSPDYWTTPQAVQTLTQALEQQLRLALRDAPLQPSQPDSNVQSQN